MKLLPAIAFAVGLSVATLAGATTLQFRIADTPANSLTYRGGLSGHVISAGIEGTFSITYPSVGTPTLTTLDLFLVNVSENFELPPFDIDDLEGSPIQDFMSHDLEGSGSYGLTSGWAIQFDSPVLPTMTEPYSFMRVDWTDPTTVHLFSQLMPAGTLDGPTVTFLPLAATLIPEPSSLCIAGAGLAFLASLRRRK